MPFWLTPPPHGCIPHASQVFKIEIRKGLALRNCLPATKSSARPFVLALSLSLSSALMGVRSVVNGLKTRTGAQKTKHKTKLKHYSFDFVDTLGKVASKRYPQIQFADEGNALPVSNGFCFEQKFNNASLSMLVTALTRGFNSDRRSIYSVPWTLIAVFPGCVCNPQEFYFIWGATGRRVTKARASLIGKHNALKLATARTLTNKRKFINRKAVNQTADESSL